MAKSRLPNTYPHDQSWISALIDRLRPVYADCGLQIPEKIRGAIGFTSRGRPPRENRKGPGVWPAETWPASATDDGFVDTFIRPDIDDALDVASIMAHELIHACLDSNSHDKDFRDAALRLGMEGRMSYALPGPAFRQRLNRLVEALGPLPRGRLNHDRVTIAGLAVAGLKKKQTTRMLPAKCLAPGCPYACRVAKQYIVDIGAPGCPKHGAMFTPPVSTAAPDADEEAEPIPVVEEDEAEPIPVSAPIDGAAEQPLEIPAADPASDEAAPPAEAAE
jgi:hypothetical protein